MILRKMVSYVLLGVLLLASRMPVQAGIEDYPESAPNAEATANEEVITFPFIRTPVPTISLALPLTPSPTEDLRNEKIKKSYADYYFVIEESLRVLEYTAEDYNHAVCSGNKAGIKRLREKMNIAILDADVLMDKLGLYNDLRLWDIYARYIRNTECGLDRGLIAETKGAMDRLHKQTEVLGLWVPSTGRSDYMMEKANCAQGLFTAPNGVCLSENGVTSTKYYHANGYAMECVWPGYCDKINIQQQNRCDWIDCN